MKENNSADAISKASLGFGHFSKAVKLVLGRALKKPNLWSPKVITFWLLFSSFVILIAYAPSWDIPRILDHTPFLSNSGIGEWVYRHITPRGQAFILIALPLLSWLFAVGISEGVRLGKYQTALSHLGLKTPTGLEPSVVQVFETIPGQKKIRVMAVGIALSEFQNKRGAFESALGMFVQDMRVSEANRQVFEFIVSEKYLEPVVPYVEVCGNLTKPFSFLIGEGMVGFMTTMLGSVNHMLIAGASGGGKSVFVKQFLIGLLESSENIQLYLIDLKKGVELNVFGRLNNVLVAKSQVSAIEMLKAVAVEMDRRLSILDKKGFNDIDCERDGLDRIVVVIDEAAELFGLSKSSRAARASAEQARDISDHIGRLGRVAGIHLVVATQKVLKDTIDTRIQANINARMVFRTQTMADSMTALGSKNASELPLIGGRGIWAVGSQEFLVQTPKLETLEVAARVAALTEKFNSSESPLLGKMLEPGKIASDSTAEAKAKSSDDIVKERAM